MAHLSHTDAVEPDGEARITEPAPAAGMLVGRVAELAALHARVAAAAAGEPSLTLIVGDGGVGKTRLAHELQTLARADGFVTLRGVCLELAVGELPYAPIAAALRDADPEVMAAALAGLPDDGLRELARIVPDIVTGVAAPPPQEDRFGQSRLFGWLLALLRRLASAAQVLLRIEDLHCADLSSQDFLRFLVQNVGGDRLAAVATVRLDELGREHPMRTLLAELGRSPIVTRMDLAPLTRDEVRRQVAQIRGDVDDPPLAEQLYRRTEGNPFYVEELLAAADREGDGLPDSLRDALLARATGLSAEAREVLLLAATAARPFDDGLIAGAAALPAGRSESALRACVDRQLLVCDRRTGAYTVRHALLREALYEDLLPAERGGCHRALAEALEGAATAENAADRAHHWTQAGEPGPAVAASIAAAEAAESVFGYGEALAHYRGALELWTEGDPPVPLAFDRVSLLARTAQAARWTGRSDLARALCETALAALDPATDPLRAARLHERLGRYQPWDVEGSLVHYREALALLPAGASADRMRLLADEALAMSFDGRWDECRARALAAIELATGEETLAIESSARGVLGVATAFLGDPTAGERHLRDALALAARARSTEDLAQTRLDLGELLRLDGRIEEALVVMLDGERETMGVGAAGSFGNFMAVNAAGDLLRLGRWDELEERLRVLAARILDRPAQLLFESTAGRLQAARGRVERAEAHFAAAVELCTTFDLAEFVPALYAGCAELSLWREDLAGARVWIEDGLAKVTAGENLLHLPGLYAMGARAQAEIAEIARFGRDDVAAAGAQRAARDHLAALTASLGERRAEAIPPEATAHLATCAAEVSRAAGEADSDRWGDAADRWSAQADPYQLAYATFRLAEAIVAARGPRGEAQAALSRSAAIAGELGAEPLLGAISAFARRARLTVTTASSTPAPTPVTAPPAAPSHAGADAFELTAREREVLALVAAGLTNREISGRLYISQHTAGVHVSHILAKLGVPNRTMAATVAERLGLVG